MADTDEIPKQRRVSFWQLGLGIILLLLGLKNLDPNAPAELKPANAGQAIGYYGVTAAFIIFGVFLIVVGIQILRRKSNA